MKRAVPIPLALFLILTLFLPGSSVQGGVLSAPTWSSIISFYNPSAVSEENGMTVVYYRGDGEPIPSQPISVNGHSSGTLMVGSIVKDPEFQGSAVISATVPLLATYRQNVAGADPYSPIIYNSFAMTDAGATAYLPSIMRTPAYDSQIGIQNLIGSDVTLKLTFYGGDSYETTAEGIIVPSQSSYIFNASQYITETDFNGSLKVEVTASDSPTPRIAAVVKDTQGGGRRAYAYEGVAGGDTVVYMPTAMCQYGDSEITTFFDVQNVGSSTDQVFIDYYDSMGLLVASTQYSTTVNVDPGRKVQLNPCAEDIIEQTVGKSMTAVIQSNSQPLAVVGKALSNDGLLTAFTGQTYPDTGMYSPFPSPLDTGGEETTNYYHLAVPYVEYSTNDKGYRTYITVMNVSGVTASDVQALYYGQDGSLIGKHQLVSDTNENMRLAPYGKRSTDPTYARAVRKGTSGFYGAVEILSDVPVVVLVRVQRAVNVNGYKTLGEDYTGMYFAEP